MSQPRGIGFTVRAFVDSDHAGDKMTCWYRTGFIIFLNSTPNFWYSNKQGIIETISFGSEFMSMKQCCEFIRGIRYKLRMMGIPVYMPTYIFVDNQSVLANTSHHHSVLRKKSSSIVFHFICEGVVKNEWSTAYLNTHLNPSDMITKYLPGGEKRLRFTYFLIQYLDLWNTGGLTLVFNIFRTTSSHLIWNQFGGNLSNRKSGYHCSMLLFVWVVIGCCFGSRRCHLLFFCCCPIHLWYN